MSAPSGRVITLHPGQVAPGCRGDTQEILRGACGAVPLADPRHTVGVMSHIAHSRPAPAALADSCADADGALQRLLTRLQAQALPARRCEAGVDGAGPGSRPPSRTIGCPSPLLKAMAA